MGPSTHKTITIDERRAKSTAWALTFADVVTLLLTFFVLLLVMLSDAEKRLSTLVENLLDETYDKMTSGLVYDNISAKYLYNYCLYTIYQNNL